MLVFPRWKKLLSLLICIIAFIITIPNFYNFNNLKFIDNQKLNLGLDLKGGSQLLLKIDFKTYLNDQTEMLLNNIRSALNKKNIRYSKLRNESDKILFDLRQESDVSELSEVLKEMHDSINISSNINQIKISYNENFLKSLKNNVIDQSIEIVRRRIDETGVREPSIQKQGEDYILLQVPGLDNPSQLKQMLGKTAKLTFHLVEENINHSQAAKSILPSNLQYFSYSKSEHGIVAKKRAAISGDVITDAKAIRLENNKPAVNLNMNSLGAKQFADLTKNNIGKILAIVLDKQIISIATISEVIKGGSSIISGDFSIESANELALLLRAGSLIAPIDIEEERIVGPNLGRDSIRAGKIAAIISGLLITIFMSWTYGIFGVFANLALFMNLILIIASLSILQATLTMPGIAGIVLTMGMAVDANVLIFERIREELKAGINNITAIDKGFKYAFTTIFDSNITTIIVAFLLYSYGSGAIKGFAVTLTIGILCSMFSAITLTKMMIISWIKNRDNQKKIIL